MTTYDAIIVLGGGRYNDGSLTELSKQRLDAGAELLKKGVAPKILAIGGYDYKTNLYTPKFLKTGAEIRKNYLLKSEVPSKNIFLVTDGGDTIAEAFACKNTPVCVNLKKLLLVTSKEHLPRSLFIFKTIFGQKYQIDGYPVDTNNLINLEEEKERMVVCQKYLPVFFRKNPNPNLKVITKDYFEIYEEYKKIHLKFHPPGKESQAYAGVGMQS